jgi:hypothetical protein
MKYFLTLLILCSLITSCIARGSAGTYYISGVAYGNGNIILTNIELTVKIGNSKNIVKTDEYGKFEIAIQWIEPCFSGGRRPKHKNHLRKLFNPKFIYICYGVMEIKVKNKWEKYGYSDPVSKEQVTWVKDLKFI